MKHRKDTGKAGATSSIFAGEILANLGEDAFSLVQKYRDFLNDSRYHETWRLLYGVCIDGTQQNPCVSFESVLINLIKLGRQRQGEYKHQADRDALSESQIKAINMILISSISSGKKLVFLSTMDLNTLRALRDNSAVIEAGIHTLPEEGSIQEYILFVLFANSYSEDREEEYARFSQSHP